MDPTEVKELLEIVLRLIAAAFAGGVLGANRELYDKPAGLRTLSLVSMGSALVMICGSSGLTHSESVGPEGVSRALQGIFSGIGFLGAGVILRDAGKGEVTGLTTAASIWIAAGLGVAGGLGLWKIMLIATVITLAILTLGQRFEDRVLDKLKKK